MWVTCSPYARTMPPSQARQKRGAPYFRRYEERKGPQFCRAAHGSSRGCQWEIAFLRKALAARPRDWKASSTGDRSAWALGLLSLVYTYHLRYKLRALIQNDLLHGSFQNHGAPLFGPQIIQLSLSGHPQKDTRIYRYGHMKRGVLLEATTVTRQESTQSKQQLRERYRNAARKSVNTAPSLRAKYPFTKEYTVPQIMLGIRISFQVYSVTKGYWAPWL